MAEDVVHQKIVKRVKDLAATWTKFPLKVEYPNMGGINLAEQVNPYVRLRIEYVGGFQTGLGYGAPERQYGFIYLEARTKKGAGTLDAHKLLRHFSLGMDRDQMREPRTYNRARLRDAEDNGWLVSTVQIPFFWDEKRYTPL